MRIQDVLLPCETDFEHSGSNKRDMTPHAKTIFCINFDISTVHCNLSAIYSNYCYLNNVFYYKPFGK